VSVILRATIRPLREAAPSTALLELVMKVLEDGKAEDAVVIDLQGKTDIADHMVVASGRSQRQVLALAEHMLDGLKTARCGPSSAEGLPHGDWVLIDAGAVIVHLFRPEIRSYYNLEKMWGTTLGEAAEAS
jgi:ribosome-associated protein